MKLLPADHPDLEDARAELVTCYAALDRNDKAMIFLEESLRIYQTDKRKDYKYRNNERLIPQMKVNFIIYE